MSLRNRLIIPLRDINGRVIAFGGRMMSEEKSLNKDNYIPKYINSPTSNLYLKRAYLYGLDSASDHIPKKKWALVVEGYFDVIALQEAGIECSLACCGTSLTKEQIELVSKIVGADGMIILLLDTDEAGEQAIERLCLQVLFLFQIKPSNVI
jgi:DNA primase